MIVREGIRNEREAKETCIIRRVWELQDDMKLETADDEDEDDEGGEAAKQAVR